MPLAATFHPFGPIRDPRSKRCLKAATADMARVMLACAQDSLHGDCTVDDLVRAGFRPVEIDECHAAAAARAAQLQSVASRRLDWDECDDSAAMAHEAPARDAEAIVEAGTVMLTLSRHGDRPIVELRLPA